MQCPFSSLPQQRHLKARRPSVRRDARPGSVGRHAASWGRLTVPLVDSDDANDSPVPKATSDITNATRRIDRVVMLSSSWLPMVKVINRGITYHETRNFKEQAQYFAHASPGVKTCMCGRWTGKRSIRFSQPERPSLEFGTCPRAKPSATMTRCSFAKRFLAEGGRARHARDCRSCHKPAARNVG